MNRSAPLPRPALMVLGLVLIALAVYWPSATGLWAYWLQVDGTTQYGMLIAALSVWLLARSWNALAAAPVEPAPWALPALLLVSAGSMLFWRAGIETLQLALLPVLLLLAVLAAFGTRIARIVAFPVLFLYFAVPGWGALWPSLQQLTILAVSVIASLVRLPAHFSGDIVTLPGAAVFEIGSKCSGVEFLIVGLAVAALIGELERACVRRRVWLMALMGSLALVSNWVRVFLIVLIGYASHMRNPLATDSHLLFGWLVFASALLGYLWLAPRRARPVRDSEDTAGAEEGQSRYVTPGGVAAVAALISFPAWVYAMDLAHGSGASTMTVGLPRARAPWSGPKPGADAQWQPRFGGAHFERQWQYEGTDGRSIEVEVVGYARQQQGRELVSEENSLVGTHGLSVIDYGLARAGGERFRELTAEDRAGHRSIIWWIYDIGGRRFATPVLSELWYGLKALVRPPRSVLYAFKAACEPSCGAARATLGRFIEMNGRDIFAAARDPRSALVGSPA
jgi:EpsI family protein